jgi:two-component system LytT family response regulator
MKLIIVDDEKRIRNTIKGILALHCPEVEIVAEAENTVVASQIIRSLQPDVVLLDIKMPGGSGFDLLKEMSPLSFKVIFITAFDQYAIEAFKFSAVDYLLKPVIPDELIAALARAKDQMNAELTAKKLEIFLENMKVPRNASKIMLNSQDKLHVVQVEEIVRCEADRNYTTFILSDKRRIVVSRSLKEYEEILTPFSFFRVHHSHLVNLAYIDHLDKKDGGMLILKDRSEVPVSSRRYSDLMIALNNL